MVESNTINEWFDEFEQLMADGVFDDVLDTNVRIRVAMEEELGRLGMSKSYRQRLVATVPVKIEVELTEEQEGRMISIAVNMVRTIYQRFSDAGFNDDAIALLGPQFELYLRER